MKHAGISLSTFSIAATHCAFGHSPVTDTRQLVSVASSFESASAFFVSASVQGAVVAADVPSKEQSASEAVVMAKAANFILAVGWKLLVVERPGCSEGDR